MSEITNLEALCQAVQAGSRPKYVFFWGHTRADTNTVGKECLSQWYPAPFDAYGHHFPTAEHFMMYRKAVLFEDDVTASKILQATTPNAVKALGRTVKDFDEALWQSHRFAVVAEGSILKFTANALPREFLLSTKERILVEASPTDLVWGIGLTAEDKHAQNPLRWRGLNLLGFALMLARSELRS
jgi:ribA/ribD-fused uncharacterized protein